MARNIEVDWVFIHVNTIRRVVVILVVCLIAGSLVHFARKKINQPPEVKARIAIEKARAVHKDARSQEMPDAWVGELKSAEKELADAREAYTDEKWDEARSGAESARYRFKALMEADSNKSVGVGQFLSVGGRVSVQRAGKSEWELIKARLPVFNGDFVKSAKDGFAEILFVDGTMYRISPNSLLEIHHKGRRAGPGSQTVKMKMGKVYVFTGGSASTLETDTASTEITSDSQVEFGVDEQHTVVTAFRGTAKIINREGEEITIGPREQVSASAEKGFSKTSRIPDPPKPVEPAHNASFDMSKTPEILLKWRVMAETVRVHLQVSGSKHFFVDEIDVDAPSLKKDSARLQAIVPGTYFWRVAGIGRGDVRSEWSDVQRFRIFTHDRQPLLKDHTPPELSVKPLQQLGHMFIVEGTTEVGAQVAINGERVEVNSDGKFRKAIEVRQNGWTQIVVVAVDPSGNRMERSQRVNVEVY